MKTKSKVFVMVGGIGNQLFILAAGLYYSEKNSTDVIFDFSSSTRGMTKHQSDIRLLSAEVSFRNRPNLYIIKNAVNRLIKWKFLHRYTSPFVGYDSALENNVPEESIFGYFQTWRYLEHPKVRKMMDSLHLDSESDWLNKCSSEMESMKTISVHIRRGDYLDLKDSFGMLGAEYYYSAINLVLENSMTEYDRILVFSDDIPLAKELTSKLDVPLPIHFAEPPGASPEESLLLMSQSSAIIISNSSFSWWAAQIGRKSKFVVCPSKWFRDMLDPEDLIPPEWHRQVSHWET